MKDCVTCGVKTDRCHFDASKPIYCNDCDPQNRCVDCGEFRMKPMGCSEYCHACYDKHREQERVVKNSFRIVDKTRAHGLEMSENHYKELNSRVVDDSGNTLRGEAGLKYMKSKGDTYASRLKEYYK